MMARGRRRRPFALITAALLMVVALGHLYRLIAGLTVMVGQWSIPLWVSAVGMVAAAGLSAMLYRESGSRR